MTGACALTALLFLPLFWHVAHTFQTSQQLMDAYIQGEQLRDRIHHLNLLLVNQTGIQVAGVEQRIGGHERDQAIQLLRRTLVEARTLHRECRTACFLTRADSLQLILRAREDEALALAAFGRREEAAALLASPSYWNGHEAFDEAIDLFTHRFKEKIRTTVQRERRQEMAALAAAGLILLASGLVWFRLVRALERWHHGILQETHERIQAERRLGRVSRRFRRLFNQAHDAIYLVSADSGRILDANLAACAQTGYSRPEILARQLLDIDADPETHDQVQAAIGGLEGGVIERRHRRRDGSSYPVEVGGRLIEDDGARSHLCMVRDLTLRRELTDQLCEARKLEYVGRLAAGIAHDFGNLLLAISGFALMGRRKIAAGESPGDSLARIEVAAQQAMGVTRSLLHFANHPATAVVPVELVSLVRDTLDLLEPSVPATVELDTSGLSVDECWTTGDPQRLQQAVLNLALNALDVMPDGGRLAVSVFTAGGPTGNGDTVHVAVADSGPGIPPQVRHRLGEPFLSTKSGGESCGLGLFNVQTILKECGGRLDIQSETGHGATFTLILPSGATPAEGPGRLTAVGTLSGAVVLAGPPELSLRLMATSLEALGLAVAVADSPAALRQELQRRPGNADLAILVGGRQPGFAAACLGILRDAAPTSKVLMSGPPPAAGHGLDELTTLPTPFTIQELCRAVRRLLEPRQCREGIS